MEDKEYKVIAVSPNPAKPYTNSYGTTYYRDVRLADAQGNEHSKPVSLGKKSEDAFQVGMELYGHIIVEQSHPTDKFKAVSKQQASFGGGGFNKPTTGTYHGDAGFSTTMPKPTYKDNSDGQRQGMCFNNAANYLNAITEPGKEKPLNAEQWAEWVHSYANALYKLGDLGKDGGETPDLKAPPASKQPWKANSQTDPLWPSDHQDDDGDIASLVATGLQADGIPLPEGW